MQKGLKKLGLTLVAVGLSIALLLTVALPVCEAGPDEKVVKIGLHATLTGPLATVGVAGDEGMIDYIRYINDQGGINGVPLKLDWVDTGGFVSKSIIAHKRFKEAGVVMELEIVSTPVETLAPRLQRDEIPMLYYGCFTYPMITEPIRWVFAQNPGWRTVIGTIMRWIKDTWTEKRPPKFGAIIYDHISARDGIKAAEEHSSEMGLEFQGYEVIPVVGVVDTSVEWLRLAARNPDWIIIGTSGGVTVTVLKDCARLEIQEKGIKVVSAAGSFYDTTLRVVGKDAEGVFIHFLHPTSALADRALPGMKNIYDAAKRYRGLETEQVATNYIGGCLLIKVAAEGLRVAIEKVGYESLTGRVVRDGLASIKDFDTGLIPPITMGESHPWFNPFTRFYEVQQGSYVPVSHWMEPPFYLEFE